MRCLCRGMHGRSGRTDQASRDRRTKLALRNARLRGPPAFRDTSRRSVPREERSACRTNRRLEFSPFLQGTGRWRSGPAPDSTGPRVSPRPVGRSETSRSRPVRVLTRAPAGNVSRHLLRRADACPGGVIARTRMNGTSPLPPCLPFSGGRGT